MIQYDEALSAIKGGNAVLIIGAGFSYAATNLNDESLPCGNTLKNNLAKAIDFSDEYGLDVVSEQYINTYGEFQLLSELKNNYIVKDFDKTYNCLSELKKAHIYSTNYDNLIEKIFEQNGNNIKSYDLNDDCRKANKGNFILHINGRVDAKTQTMDNIRLTLGSYNKDFNTNAWIKFFADDLKCAEAIFIIGHSLMPDLDLRRLVVDYREKCFIIQHPNISKSEKDILSSYGRVCENGVLQFLCDLKRVPTPKVIKQINSIKLKSFKRIKINKGLTPPTDQEIFDFVIKGEETDNVYFQINNEFTSLINRNQLISATQCLKDGKNLILHSNLGNGKSIFLKQLMRMVSDREFLLYQDNYAADYIKELKKLSEINEKIVLIFDPFNAQYEAIRMLNRYAFGNIQFILMARTPLFENMENRLDEDLNNYEKVIIDLNQLTWDECEEINLILQEYGLWGKHAALSEKAQMHILTQNCKSRLQEIILFLFDTCDIKKRFEELIKDNVNKKIKKLLVLSFINSVIELRFTINDFNLLFPDLDVFKIYRNDVLKEFANFNHYGNWEIKSPIVAKSMLNSDVFNKKEIVDSLIDLTKKLDSLHEGCSSYTNALKQLCSCSYLSFIFNYDIDKSYILNYFEAVKSTSFNTSNYFFWMQYAIACVNIQSYERAEKYFETAYSFARRRGKTFSTFQIDNHYARFLLERQIYSRNVNNAFLIFKQAHQLLIKSKRDSKSDNRYYQFRVARNYREYYNIFYNGFDSNEKGAFIICCKEINSDLKAYENEMIRRQMELRNDVQECKNNIKYILEKCNR